MKSNLYDKAKIELDDVFDVSYIIQKLEEIEKLKIICLTFEQCALFNYITKDLCSLDEIKQDEDNYNRSKESNKYDKDKLAEIISKFICKDANDDKGLSEIDKKYDLLNDDLKF